jgi:hypothetical protein
MTTENNEKIARFTPEVEEKKYGRDVPAGPCEYCGAREDQDCKHGGGECPLADEASLGIRTIGAHSFTDGSDLEPAGIDLQRCELELFVEKYFGLKPGLPETAVIPGADYGQIVGLIAFFREEQDKRFVKARILEAFNNVKGADNPYSALEQVLDELNIK